MSPQSGKRFSLCCFTMPCFTSWAGVMGWKTGDRGSHPVPSSLTATTMLQSGTALSANTYLPVSANTWANLQEKETQGKGSQNGAEPPLGQWYLVELKLDCCISVCKRRKAPKSQLGLLLNR